MGRLSRLLRPGLRAVRDASTAVGLTERLGAVTHAVSSLEYLARGNLKDWGGPNNWAVTRQTFHERSAGYGKLLDVVADPRVTKAVHIARVVAAASLWAPLPRGAKVAANGVLAASQVALYARHLYGTDGADQVSFLVQTVATLARAGQRKPELVDACMWFLALQSVLSYTVSGWAKLPSETWRSGRALPGITRTRTYGDRAVWTLMRRYPRLTKLTAHGVLAMECSFPLVYAFRGRLAPLFLGSAGAFHLVNARVMGLGRFFWAFVSTYPSVLYTSGPSQRRDDTMPRLCLAVLGGALAAGQVAARRRAKAIAAGRGDEQTITASSGNVLSYRRTGTPSPGKPVLVFESGLASTAEHWEWIAGQLAQTHEVVTYNRAGYGASRYRGGADYQLDTAVDDLVDLVRAIGDRCVFVGHSLGGYLAMRAAERLGGQVAGLVLVDSSHPAELRRSPAQKRGAESLDKAFALMPSSLRAGLGWLLKRPSWIDRMPTSVRGLALAQYRDARLWSTATREWKATQAHFAAFDGPLPAPGAPMLVISAGTTVEIDPVHAELHDELAATDPRSRRVTLAGFDHDEVLTDPVGACRVADLITDFLREEDSRALPVG
ncbi:alpha/beta fold hydrolase [Actinokineospora sp. NPDC004072]